MYKTGFLKVKTQILETIFAELPQTAKKVKLTIKFDDEEKLNTFKRLEAQRKEDEQDCASLDSESESEEDEGPFMDPLQLREELSSKEKLMLNKEKEVRIRPQKIQVSLEQGIIYKQFYQESFKKIGQSFNVKIKIRAQKITFQGYQIDDIQDAMVQVTELRNHIEIQYIPKSGLEMSESTIIKQKLDKVGVKLFRILDKYYQWYEISPNLSHDQKKEKRTAVKKVLTDIDKFIHCLQYLHSIDQEIDMHRGSKGIDFLKLQQNFMNYRPLLEQLKAKVFQKQLSQKINEEMGEDYLEAELSISQDALIFHSFAKELLEMTIKEVRVQFQAYDYFYLTIDSDYPIEKAIKILKTYEYDTVMESSKVKSVIGQIEQVKQINFIHFTTNYEKAKQAIELKMKAPTYFGDYIPKESVNFCIGFRRKYPERRLQFLCQILQKLHTIWVGASYKISIGLQQEDDLEDNSISYQYNQAEKIFSISANQNSLETNLSILRNYVIKKKLQQKRTKLLKLENEDNNVSLSTINASSYIQESTYLNQKSMNQDLNTSSILDAVRNDLLHNENQFHGQDQQDDKQIQFLKQYRVFLPETSKEYNEKYNDSKVKQNQIAQTDKRNRPLEEQLSKVTDSTFQVLKVKLNPKRKVESFYENPQRDEIVTVFILGRISPFVKPKDLGLKIEQGLNQTFPIRFLSKRETISQSGYLLNIKKRSIEVHGKSYKVKYGAQFQVAKAITYLKK